MRELDWVVEDGRVVENGLVPGGHGDIGRIVIESPLVVERARPGQFVMVRVWDGEPLLPRAMAPLRYDLGAGQMEIIYRVKGAGTRAMQAASPSAFAQVTGPLGKPVEWSFAGQVVALIGRGVGITPLLPLARLIVDQGGTVNAYLSARTRAYLFGCDEFARIGGVAVQIDDEPGGPLLVTEHLIRDCRRMPVALAFVCGARRLLSATHAIASAAGFPAYAFLESKMACGVGYCKGCPWPARGGGYRLVCQEGPLFPTAEIEATDEPIGVVH